MSLSFEDVYCLLETEIQAILKLANYKTRGFLVDRYITTVLLANSNLLKPEDYKCAINPRFQELYFNDAELAKVQVIGYANRFFRLRLLLGCENKIISTPTPVITTPVITTPVITTPVITTSVIATPVITTLCNDQAIRRAIDRYPVRDDHSNPELFGIPITQLAEQFGQDAFNVEYLELMYDNLGMTRRGGDTTLRGLVGYALRGYKFTEAERQSAKTPEQIRIESNNHWFQPSWNPSWSYMKCLLRVLQSDSRTRTEFDGMVSDQELGIITNNRICDRDTIQRAIDEHGADLVSQPIIGLSRLYGQNAFNTRHLEYIKERLDLEGNTRDLSQYITGSLSNYNTLESELWGNEAWEYMKCLLRILQSNAQTRRSVYGMPTDSILGSTRPLETYCNRQFIQLAIDQYGADLLDLSVDQLAREFGKNAFNPEYLNEMYDTLRITRMGRNIPINFGPIVFNALQMYNSLERENSGEEIWEYMKCLLRVLQSDTRTRQEIMGMPTDAELGL